MIFPIGDDNIEGGAKPIFSYGFIALNVIMFAIQLMTPGMLFCDWGLLPAEIMRGEDYFTFMTNMFMHGGWMHIIGNMLFLWVFADNVEATIGNIPFLIFYLLGGFFASAAHVIFTMGALDPSAVSCCAMCLQNCVEGDKICPGTIPSLGASGALAAVMGAYMVMFPKSKVKILVLYFMRSFHIPAFIALGLWIVMQLFSGVSSLGPAASSSGGTAWWAHIGGFVFGVVAGFLFKIWMAKSPDDNNLSPRSKGDYV